MLPGGLRGPGGRRAVVATLGLLALAAACNPTQAPAPLHPLDQKDGFRDVSFGQSPAQIRGIDVTKPVYGTDAKSLYRTYLRANEDLLVGETPLQEIRYGFFRDQLTEIHLLWDPKPHLGTAVPPIYGFLTNHFGIPTSQVVDVKRREVRAVWDAQWVRLTLIEEAPQERLPGRGVVTITSKPLVQQRDAAGREAAARPKAGF